MDVDLKMLNIDSELYYVFKHVSLVGGYCVVK